MVGRGRGAVKPMVFFEQFPLAGSAGFRSSTRRAAMQTRRQFIVRGTTLVAVGAVATAAGPTILVRDAKAAGQLKILQWSHFVPAYDKWFDPFAKEWGAKKGVEVTVDHVGFADVVPRATAEVAAQSGHDIHMFIGLASAFEEHVVDLKDVVG